MQSTTTATKRISNALRFAALCTLALLAPASPTQPVQLADRIILTKATHTLVLYHQGKPLRTYRVSLGSGGSAPKQQQGDHLTPEGHYVIDAHNPHSSCYRSLHISYPNAADRARAAAAHVQPGGDVMIHGLPNGFPDPVPPQILSDWTWGCIGVTDAEIDEIYRLVPNGTPIDLKP